jgi:MFS transporter, UMF1 family
MGSIMPADAQPTGRSMWSWAIFALGNHFFALNIASLYFSLWVVNIMGARDADYGLANSISMGIIFLGSPLLGALTDQAPRRMPFLIAATLLCVGFTLALGHDGLFVSLACFVIANIGYQAGLQFYDSLLPSVSTPDRYGRVGGIGMAVGYLGSLLAILLGKTLLKGADLLPHTEATARYVTVFQASALLFLTFALPCFFFVRERVHADRRFTLASVSAAVKEVGHTLRRLPDFPGVGRYLVARFFFTDAVNTVIAFMGIYVTNEVGFTVAQASLVMLVALVVTIPCALAWGRAVDAIGPKRTLNWVLVLWMIDFAWVAAIGFFKLPGVWFWSAACLTGIALGGTGAAERPMMLRLTPPDRVGEFFGLYGMVGRFSAIIGPFLWGVVTDYMHLGRPMAILTLLAGILISFTVLQAVPDGAVCPEARS